MIEVLTIDADGVAVTLFENEFAELDGIARDIHSIGLEELPINEAMRIVGAFAIDAASRDIAIVNDSEGHVVADRELDGLEATRLIAKRELTNQVMESIHTTGFMRINIIQYSGDEPEATEQVRAIEYGR